MSQDERQYRLNLFLEIAEEIPLAKQTIDNVFRLVCKYDVPKHTDREFIYDCLILYYSKLEEYEKKNSFDLRYHWSRWFLFGKVAFKKKLYCAWRQKTKLFFKYMQN